MTMVGTIEIKSIRSIGTRAVIFVLCIVVNLGLAAAAMAAASESQYELRKRDAFFSVWAGEQGDTWAVGKRGLIVRSTDGMKTWQQVPSGVRNSLNKIMFRGDQGWIVGNDGLILHSQDKGATWTKVDSGPDFVILGLVDIEFFTDEVGVVATEEGAILLSHNGGASWERYPLDWLEKMPVELTDRGIYAMNFYDICVLDQDKAWIVGDWGTVMYTMDRGQNWEILRCGYYPHLLSAVFLDEQRGLAVGQNGIALVTGDGGRTWTDMPGIKTSYSLFKIAIQGTCGLIVGEQGKLWESTDRLVSWKEVTPKAGAWYCDAALLNGEGSCNYVFAGSSISAGEIKP